MEVLDIIWQYIAPIFGGLSIAGIVSAIIYGCLKGAFNRTISKINTEKIAKDAVDKGVEKVKEVSFKHNIQPIVESELKKVTEEANKYLEQELASVKEQYTKLLNVLGKFAAYFDNSIGVPDEAKEELKQALKDAEIEPTTAEISVDSEIVVEDTKSAEKPIKTALNKASNTVQGDR